MSQKPVYEVKRVSLAPFDANNKNDGPERLAALLEHGWEPIVEWNCAGTMLVFLRRQL
jgi:hypothetical protein